jgi:spore maturation protein CgeB
MKIVVFGLTVSSSWGNGHATLWRGLCRALSERGHDIVFFERTRRTTRRTGTCTNSGGGELVLYSDWGSIRRRAGEEIADADVAMVTSYCPDGRAATNAVLDASRALRVFYDLDTPITLSRMARGETTDYIGPGRPDRLRSRAQLYGRRCARRA